VNTLTSATMAGGASPEHDRHDSDFYQTPADVTRALLKHLPEWRKRNTWEPACGDGAISHVVSGYGAMVLNTDIRMTFAPYMRVMDFLTTPLPIGTEQIITNPPFNLAAEFIEYAATLGVPFAFLLKTQFFHAASRQRLFTMTGPMAVLPLTWRPSMAPDRGNSPTMEFSWVVWDKKPTQPTYYYPLARPRDA
jgi:hypothetical protein